MDDGDHRHRAQRNGGKVPGGKADPARRDVGEAQLDVAGSHGMKARHRPAGRHVDAHAGMGLGVGRKRRLHQAQEGGGAHNPNGHGPRHSPAVAEQGREHQESDRQGAPTFAHVVTLAGFPRPYPAGRVRVRVRVTSTNPRPA